MGNLRGIPNSHKRPTAPLDGLACRVCHQAHGSPYAFCQDCFRCWSCCQCLAEYGRPLSPRERRERQMAGERWTSFRLAFDRAWQPPVVPKPPAPPPAAVAFARARLAALDAHAGRSTRPLDLAVRAAVHLRRQGVPWDAVGSQTGVELDDLFASVAFDARSLEWVAEGLKGGTRAADMRVVAANVGEDERAARWWVARAPNAGVFDSEALQALIQRERRRADLGPGWARRVKGEEVSLHEGVVAGQVWDADTRQIEAKLEVEALQARAHLTPRQAEVVAEVRVRGGPEYGVLTEVASELGLDPGAVRRYWHDALEKLRRAAAG